jgi:glycine/serine hydroxymethyltransferase
MKLIGTWMAKVLDQPADEGLAREVAREVRELAHGFPLFSWTALPRTGVRAG